MITELLERCEQWESEGGIWNCWVSKLITLSGPRDSESGTRKPPIEVYETWLVTDHDVARGEAV